MTTARVVELHRVVEMHRVVELHRAVELVETPPSLMDTTGFGGGLSR